MLLSGLLSGMALAWPLLDSGRGPLDGLTSSVSELFAEWNRDVELSQHTDMLNRRNELKGEVTEQFLAGEIDLDEAIHQFGAAMEETALAHDDDDEVQLVMIVNVYRWVSYSSDTDPRAEKLLPKVRAEIARRHGMSAVPAAAF